MVDVTCRATDDERLAELRALRTVRDRIDRDHALPLDVPGRGLTVSARQVGRRSKEALGASPCSGPTARPAERATTPLRTSDASSA